MSTPHLTHALVGRHLPTQRPVEPPDDVAPTVTAMQAVAPLPLLSKRAAIGLCVLMCLFCWAAVALAVVAFWPD